MGCSSSSPEIGDKNNNNDNKDKNPKIKNGFRTNGVILEEPETENVIIDYALPEYPSPIPPPKSKEEIFCQEDQIISHQVAQSMPVETFSTLQEFGIKIKEQFPNDVRRVCCVFTWIGLQNINQRQYPKSIDPTSILADLQQVASKSMSLATLFAKLCRAADIPCVIIKGIAKSAAYEVGDQEVDGLRNTWNAVYVANGWYPAFPLWGLSSIVGHETGTWTLVETKGQGVRKQAAASEGKLEARFDYYYLLTNPDELVHVCLPDDSTWQLLKKPYSKEDFIKVPYLREKFFQRKLEITSEPNCVLQANDGEAFVSIRPCKGAEHVTMTYELYFNHEKSEDTLSDDIQLERYVATMNTDEGRSRETGTLFSMRFPVRGIYKLIIKDNEADWLAFFKILCSSAKENCRPFPVNSEIGYGPCAETEKAGMVPKTHKSGVIVIQQTKHVEVKFTLRKNISVQTRLVHNTISSDELQKFVNHTVKDKELVVNLAVPTSGEYALQISSKEKGSQKNFSNVCNYLITPEEPKKKKKKKNYETPPEKNARKDLEEVIYYSKDPKDIQRCLDKFNSNECEDRGEISKAKTRMRYLELLLGLNEAIDRRNIELLEKAIAAAETDTEHQERLSHKVKQARDLLEHLRMLRRFAHEVLKLNQTTISEVHHYMYPKAPVMHDVMKATYLLLGEEEQNIYYWPDIQALMRKTGKSALLHRIKSFDTVHIREESVSKSAKIMAPFEQDAIATCSAAIGAFYIWVKNIINFYYESQKPAKSKEETEAGVLNSDDQNKTL